MRKSNLTSMQNPDGVYAVYITTQHGDCDKSYQWKISVSGDASARPEDTPMEASGQINQRGVVALAFQRHGPGRHGDRKSREGVWLGHLVSSTMQCGGSWRAMRQG